MINVRKVVSDLEEYYVLQDFSTTKLNQNESPYDIPEEIKSEILRRLDHSNWNRYSQLKASSLINAISAYLNHPAAGIVVGNGSNEMIHAVFSTFCEPKDKVIVVSPGFLIYPRIAKLMGCEIIDIPLKADFSFDVPEIITRSCDARMIILASPNNPTGTKLSLEEIEEIANKFNSVFVIDEAYYEFNKETTQELINKYPHIIIIRTFSKAFSLAGLRLGYLIADPQIAKEIDKAKLPFSVSIFQQIAGEAMMNHREYVKNFVEKIISQREQVFSELERIKNINPIKSHTNFILFEVINKSAKEIFESIYKRGVLLRYFGDKRLENYLRVTIGTPEENKIFLEKLKLVLEAYS